MDYIAFYDRFGKPVAWLDDNTNTIYYYNGRPVAWLQDKYLYGFSGRFLGWYENGWINDLSNRPIFFDNHAVGGPTKPTRQTRPTRGTRQTRPTKGTRQTRPTKPTKSLSWSQLNANQFFGV